MLFTLALMRPDYKKNFVRSLLSTGARDLFSVIFFYRPARRPVELVGLLHGLVVVWRYGNEQEHSSRLGRMDGGSMRWLMACYMLWRVQRLGGLGSTRRITSPSVPMTTDSLLTKTCIGGRVTSSASFFLELQLPERVIPATIMTRKKRNKR